MGSQIRPGWRPISRRTRRPDRVLYRSRTHLNFQSVYRRAGDGHHEGRRIAEVALKLDARRAARQLWTKRLKLEIDVAELLPSIRDVFRKLDVDDGQARKRNGPDAILVGRRRVDRFVFGDGLLDRPRDELLHFLSGRARPLAGRDRYPDWYVRIFALRHREISINAPRDHAHQRRQGDLTVLHEKPRGVVRLLNSFLICLMCHVLYPV